MINAMTLVRFAMTSTDLYTLSPQINQAFIAFGVCDMFKEARVQRNIRPELRA
jgi:hypothetical protein